MESLVEIRLSDFLYRSEVICTSSFFFFNDTATTEIYTLSLHDALPIFRLQDRRLQGLCERVTRVGRARDEVDVRTRSEEHTSELQSQSNLVCRLLLEKKINDQHVSKPMKIISLHGD